MAGWWLTFWNSGGVCHIHGLSVLLDAHYRLQTDPRSAQSEEQSLCVQPASDFGPRADAVHGHHVCAMAPQHGDGWPAGGRHYLAPRCPGWLQSGTAHGTLKGTTQDCHLPNVFSAANYPVHSPVADDCHAQTAGFAVVTGARVSELYRAVLYLA